MLLAMSGKSSLSKLSPRPSIGTGSGNGSLSTRILSWRLTLRLLLCSVSSIVFSAVFTGIIGVMSMIADALAYLGSGCLLLGGGGTLFYCIVTLCPRAFSFSDFAVMFLAPQFFSSEMIVFDGISAVAILAQAISSLTLVSKLVAKRHFGSSHVGSDCIGLAVASGSRA